MIDSLFGSETPLLVKLIIAFGVVLGLIAASTWALRRVGGTRLGVTTPRGRQPRLAVIDAAAVDTRRRLVLIRRDNVEHLIMIGGPTDVVVEQNIVRAIPVPSAREAMARDMGAAPPEPQARLSERPQERPAELPRSAGLPGVSAPRPQQPPEPSVRPPISAEALFGGGPELPRGLRPEPPPRRPSPSEPSRMPRPRSTTREGESPIDLPVAPPTADTNLADMAQRLEEALKRPSVPRKEPEVRAAQGQRKEPDASKSSFFGPPAPPAGAGRPDAPAVRSETAANPNPEAADTQRPPAGEAAPAEVDPKSVFDSLEEEMASLLNRPPGKE